MAHALGLVSILVRDYDEAIAFYVGTLGFTLVEDTPLDAHGKRWVVVAPSGARESGLLLARAADAEEQARVGDQAGGRVFLFLETDDFARDYRAFASRGVKFVRPPREEPYGTVAVFADLYGNLWDLLQRKRPAAKVPARNVEIKARVADLAAVEDRARAVATAGPVDLAQDDTFFACAAGRLKLRALGDTEGQLIHYFRADAAAPRVSDYVIAPTSDPAALRAALSRALAPAGRVRKARRLYLADRTRIHLDRVEGLGDFVELEVVLGEDETLEQGEATARRLMAALGIDASQLIGEPYVDLQGQAAVAHIFVAPAKGEPARAVQAVEALAGEGLAGDRYAIARNRRGAAYEVTLIEIEHIEDFTRATGLALTPEMPRRNIVTRGVRLNDLCGRRFAVGGALFEGLELCEPCKLFARRTHREVLAFFAGKGGLRARIVEGAPIRVGDPVRTL